MIQPNKLYKSRAHYRNQRITEKKEPFARLDAQLWTIKGKHGLWTILTITHATAQWCAHAKRRGILV